MRCFLLGLAGFMVAAIAAFFISAGYGDYASRASLSETVAAALPLQAKITEELNARPPKPAAQPTIAGADYVRVSADGLIVFRSLKHGQLIVYEPTMKDGKVVAWRCIGGSIKEVPLNCR
jgi:hypothetical protein